MNDSPVTSLLIAIPFVVLLGIFVNIFRIAIFRLLFKKLTYNLLALPQVLLETLKFTVANQLSIDQSQVDFRNDQQFETTRQLLLPEMDEYSIRSRWLHDLCENVVMLVGYALIVLIFRAIVFNLEGIDWALILSPFFIGCVALISLPNLRNDYTISEASLVVKMHISHQSYKPTRDEQVVE